MMWRSAITASLVIGANLAARGQGCCSGGSGSPIAGGASQGVLQERQFEVSVNHQYVSTSKFFSKDRDTIPLFDRLSSNYLYGRIAYGVTNRLTMSVEGGYYLNRTQFGRERTDTVRSGGIADIILFPRYCVLSRNTESTRTELSVGLGLKLPVGKYNDSTVVYRNPVSGVQYYTTAPPTIQPTNGSNDFIFYGFAFRGYTEAKFRVFASMIFLRRGWNPLGQKFGDYASLGLFAGKNLTRKFSLTVQVRGEWVAPMQYDRQVDMLALYNIDVHSTGSRKVFVSPQIGCALGSFILYALYEMPVYQFVNGTQVGSQHMATAGVSYRFFVKN